MTEHARLTPKESRPRRRFLRPRSARRRRSRYYAFLSYSHRDDELADWLHRQLEDYHVPTGLAGKLTDNGVVPKRLSPIFRDEHELAAADDLGEEIEAALSSSQFLIVLCSPDAAKSRWTNAEIELFKRTRPDGCVLAAIASGEPFASDIPGREHEECFPPALRQRYDRRGRPTGKRAEPLAADLREEGDGRRLGFLKLVAGMLGVGLDDLVQRETTRRHRRMAWLAAASLAGMAVTSTLAFTAIQARDAARDQRREAEGLVAFMLGDLKDKLEPIGRLDALDGVGSRVLAYYSKQDAADLPDAALLQRSRALSLTAEVSYQRGSLGTAMRLYREAMAGTAEAIRRNPNDPQRLFDHAQNVFWVGDIARQRGDRAGAEAAAREYKRLALGMLKLDPNSMKWRMEEQYADANLGVVLYEQRRFAEAASQFAQALHTIEALATADPRNADYRASLAESLAWLADAQMSEGQIDAATQTRQRHVALLNNLLAASGDDVQYRQRLIQAHRALGTLYAYRGKMQPAAGEFAAAVADADTLARIEPANRQWQQYGADARLNLADTLLATGNRAQAAAETGTACAAIQQLLARDPNVQRWRMAQRDCLMMKAELAQAAGKRGEVLSFAEQAVTSAKSVKGSDTASADYAVAKAYRLVGDIKHALGDAAGTRAAWSAAFAALPSDTSERPAEMAERAAVLQRLGRRADADRIKAKLRAIGYQRTS
jgi:tetratricopeptide (TPR) repeat protein